MIEETPRSVPRLIGDAIREAQNLVARQIELFRAEMTDGLRHLTGALILFIAAGVFALTGLLVLIVALVKGLAVLLHSEALAALIVGGIFGAVAIGLALWGRSKASLSGLEPTRSERQLKQDAGAITKWLEE